MLSLVRFLIILAVLGGIAYGGMFALVSFVEPNPREMTVRLPASKINPEPVPLPPIIRVDPSATGQVADEPEQAGSGPDTDQ